MSTDYAAIEREFLDSLEADTGRDLAGWMRAIDDASLPHRNDIIDWLRHQGFLFARASWLERIHNNGGKPLYADRPPGKIAAPRRPRQPERPFPAPLNAVGSATSPPAVAPDVSPPPPAAPPEPAIIAAKAIPDAAPAAPSLEPPPPSSPAPATQPAPPAPAPSPTNLEETLARAKAFRPLAQYLLRTVDKAVPGTEVTVKDGNLCLSRPQAYALIIVSPRDLRLLVDIGGDAPGAHLQPARVPGLEPRFRHMLVLNDARQLNSDLESLLRVADANVNNRR